MTDDFILKIRRFDPTDKRLGRHVVHDSRSLRYLARVADPSKLTSVRHNINIPILDQGEVGSCTGHAATAAASSDAYWNATKRAIVDQPHVYAVGLYSAATLIDPWPGQYTPDDTGSDGLSVSKVLLTRNLIAGYQHATSLAAALTALAERPVIVGTSWLEDMFEPDATGKLSVSGEVAGGHEYCLDELDVEHQRVWLRNSWTATWGVQGRAWMTWDDLGKLLADDGDCTVLVPITEPAPQPAPVPPPPAPPPPAPAPAPGPAPAPAPAPTPAPKPTGPTADEGLLAEALKKFIRHTVCPAYLRVPATAWLATLPKGVKR